MKLEWSLAAWMKRPVTSYLLWPPHAVAGSWKNAFLKKKKKKEKTVNHMQATGGSDEWSLSCFLYHDSSNWHIATASRRESHHQPFALPGGETLWGKVLHTG